MSIFTGRQYPGAMRDHRTTKREEAEARNALTPPERRSVRNGGDLIANAMTAREASERFVIRQAKDGAR